MSSNTSKAIEHVNDERKDFIIIGLTGRTGSGCSTVANLLKTENFSILNPPIPQKTTNNKCKKYFKSYSYMEKNWQKFTVIRMKDIITSFILEYDFDNFLLFLKSCLGKLFNRKLQVYIEKNLKEEFNRLNEKRLLVKSRTEENADQYLKSDECKEFYFTILPVFTDKLKSALNIQEKGIYTKLYQEIGNRIRTSGKPYEDTFSPQNIFKLSERTNTLIKILRKRNIEEKGRVLVVIDTFRNPFEATFFKDRYSSFYLMAINTEEEVRKKRLTISGLNYSEIEEISKTEYPQEKQIGHNIFSHQNIEKCLEIADIFLHNPVNKKAPRSELKMQLIKYLSLIIHPGLVAPTHIERIMQIAYSAKMSSGCISRQVGAVITDKYYSVKAIGWNSVPAGQTPCNLRNLKDLIEKKNKKEFSEYELSNKEFRKEAMLVYKDIEGIDLNGRIYNYCFKDLYCNVENEKNQVHTRSLHAEENAFLQITKYGGIGIQGGYLFTTASPCELCSKKAYQIGIKKIYYIDPYPGISSSHILKNGKSIPKLILFKGVVGMAYSKLYLSRIPYKDELKMFCK